MSEAMWVRSHVERLLQDEWGQCRVTADDDGDYPFRAGTAACWVSVTNTEPVMVRVWAYAATGMRPTLKLLAELNDIQTRTLSAAVTLDHNAVIVHQTISPVGLTQPVLAQALCSVSGVADDIGLLLASMFNGSMPFPVEESQSQDAA